MRLFSTSLLVVAGLLAAPAFSGDGEKKREREGDGPPRIPPELLKKFDADGDGKLNEDERATAKKAMAEHRKERGDGPPPELLKKFDADGDGKLSEAERAELKKAMAERHRKGGEGDQRKKREGGDK